MKGFCDIAGHQNIIEHIKTAYQTGKVSHAYIFEGEEGSGRKTLVNAFVRLLQCEQPQAGEPCNQCSSCRQVASYNHPDVIYIQPTKKTGYGIEDIRTQLVKDINIKPYKSKYKIYIIDQADTMTVQAQNSMLKTIEEPPDYGLFFLIGSNKWALLETIRSRSVLINVRPIGVDLVKAYLIDHLAMEAKEALVLSRYSGGNIGKAVMVSQSGEFKTARTMMMKLLKLFINGKEYDIINQSDLLEEVKQEIDFYLQILISLIRDVIYYAETKDLDRITHCDIGEFIVEQGDKGRSHQLISLLNNILAFKKYRKANVNNSLSIMDMLINR